MAAEICDLSPLDAKASLGSIVKQCLKNESL